MTAVIITGAASGIGAAIANRVAAPGVKLVLHSRKNIRGLLAVAEAAQAAGAETETAILDLSDPSNAAKLVQDAVDFMGGIDWLISNAGFADSRLISDLPDDGVQASMIPLSLIHI